MNAYARKKALHCFDSHAEAEKASWEYYQSLSAGEHRKSLWSGWSRLMKLPKDFKGFIEFVNLENVPYLLIGQEDLIINKLATGREKDIVDATNLRRGQRSIT